MLIFRLYTGGFGGLIVTFAKLEMGFFFYRFITCKTPNASIVVLPFIATWLKVYPTICAVVVLSYLANQSYDVM